MPGSNLKLILIRHADAGHNPGGRDFDRELTTTGFINASKTGNWISLNFPETGLVMTSEAVRAQATCDCIVEKLESNPIVKQSKELYEASVRTFLMEIASIDSKFETVAVVAHNPTITYVSEVMTGEAVIGMSPGTAIGMILEVDAWEKVGEKSARIFKSYSPNMES